MASAMLQRMGLTLEAASEITSAQGQGLITLDNFAQMDKDGIKMLFYSLARPGGTDAAGNRNPGTKVSAQAQAAGASGRDIGQAIYQARVAALKCTRP